MDKQEQNIFDHGKCLTQEELRAYLDGDLSHSDQHRVEKHLLDCEMCADELEGMQMLSHEVYMQRINELKNEFKNRFISENKTAVPFYLRREFAMVASLLLLLGVGVLIKLMLDKEPEIKLAENTLAQDSVLFEKDSALEIAAKEAEAEEPMIDKPVPQQVKKPVAKSQKEVILKELVTPKQTKQVQPQLPSQPQPPQLIEIVEDDMEVVEELEIVEEELVLDEAEEYEMIEVDMSYSLAEEALPEEPVSIELNTAQEVKKKEQFSRAKQSNAKRIRKGALKMSAPQKLSEVEFGQGNEVQAQQSNWDLAMEQFETENFILAKDYFTKAKTDGSVQEGIQYYLGRCEYELGSFEKAIIEFELLPIEQSKLKEHSDWYLALSYKSHGQIEKANQLLKKISALGGIYSEQATELLGQ